MVPNVASDEETNELTFGWSSALNKICKVWGHGWMGELALCITNERIGAFGL